MNRSIRFFLPALAALATSASAALTVGYQDTFSGGSFQDWQKGQSNPAFLSVSSSGGPGGAGDSFLMSSADGSGSFGRLTIINQDQWNSNFGADGVTTIRMNLLNAASTPLSIRIGLRDSNGQGFISKNAFPLTPGGGWQTADFSVLSQDMAAVGAPGAFSSFLAGGFSLRILHATGTSNLSGDPVISSLGIDNITAIPEPASSVVFVAAAAALCTRRRRTQSC